MMLFSCSCSDGNWNLEGEEDITTWLCFSGNRIYKLYVIEEQFHQIEVAQFCHKYHIRVNLTTSGADSSVLLSFNASSTITMEKSK